MASVKRKDTKPEIIVRKILHSMGYRYRLHRKDLPGLPDIVLPKYHKVIFVHGCFWHGHEGCRRAKLPETNREFWEEKIRKNVERDRDNYTKLVELGWQPIIIWGCEVRDFEKLRERLRIELL